MIWEKKYETGDSLIDNQHQTLFALTNKLGDALDREDAPEVVDKVFAALVLYILEHFRDEENLMRNSGYVHFSSHRRLHMDLSILASDHLSQYRNAEHKDPRATHEFLVEWITDHIMGDDYDFFLWLREKKAKQASKD